MIQNKIGTKYRPTFSSSIDYFEITGYDEERDMLLTKIHSKEGQPFDDEIETSYFENALEIREYKEMDTEDIHNMKPDQIPNYVLHNYYNYPQVNIEQKYCGPCCTRCLHRFGTTSNSKFCSIHYNDKRCYRFKLEK